MKHRTNAPSTDPRDATDLVREAWELTKIDGTAQREAAARLRVGVSHLAAALDDEAVIAKHLATLSAAHLIVLEVLAEAGGRVTMKTLEGEVERRIGLQSHVVKAVLDDLLRACLAVTLVSRNSAPQLASLVRPGCEHVARRVRGISLPDAGSTPEMTPIRDPGQLSPRDAIALIALTAHRKLRFNVSHTVNRSGLRPFLKGIGVTEQAAERVLQRAIELDVLGASGERLVPFASRVIQLARQGGFPVYDRRIGAWLQGRDWTSVEALARAMTMPTLGRHTTIFALSEPDRGSRPMEMAIAAIAKLDGLEHAEARGARWVRRPPVGAWSGDGHVTPSFDVLLGPDAGLELTAVLALGAELTRVDRMLTLRIGPASVAAGIARGLDAERFVSALEHVAARPLPDNVRAMLGDWTGRARVARRRAVTMLELPADVAEAIAAGPFAKHVVAHPTPGVLLVERSLSSGKIEAELGRHGVSLAQTSALTSAVLNRQRARYGYREADSDDLDGDEEPSLEDDPLAPLETSFGSAPALPLESVDAKLRAHFVAARERGSTSVETPATERTSGSATPSTWTPRFEAWCERLSREASSTPTQKGPALTHALGLIHDACVDATPTLARWLDGLPPAEQERALDELTPLTILTWLSLTAKFQRRVLERARTVARLIEKAEESRHHLSPRGTLLARTSEAVDPERLATILDAIADRAPTARAQTSDGPPSAPVTATSTASESAAMSPQELAVFFERIPPGTSVRMALKTANGDTRAYDAVFNGVQRRGTEMALLTIEHASDEGRVIAMRDVLAATQIDADATKVS